MNQNVDVMLTHQSTQFVFDTAATCHIICDRMLLTNFHIFEIRVKWGDSTLYKLENCLYKPLLGINLISHPQLQENFTWYFKKFTCQILFEKIFALGRRVNNLFYLNIDHVAIPE